ncbi:hypothetical protein Y017_05375 [Alcanivorax sp. 97CO-5]|nr:hypothetical protein Y017_05375 [Alcanivorax sp. 97CO-5]
MATRKAAWLCYQRIYYRQIFYLYMWMAQFKPEHCKQTRPPTPASFGAFRLYLKQESALPCTPNSKTAPFACPVRRSK